MEPVWSNIGPISSRFLNRSQTKYEIADIEHASRRVRAISLYGRQGEGSFYYYNLLIFCVGTRFFFYPLNDFIFVHKHYIQLIVNVFSTRSENGWQMTRYSFVGNLRLENPTSVLPR